MLSHENKMKRIILLITISIIASLLIACVGINKTKQNIAVYDFGLNVTNDSNQRITSKLFIETPVAAESLNQNKIRYRLNYQNPLRIFFYTESRWMETPAGLFVSKLSRMVDSIQAPANCSLKLKIETFDQVFYTTTTSDGVVQLSAFIVEKKSKKLISSQLITENVTSLSPNAQGGTAALQQASENALKKVISWGNMLANNNELCK